MAGSLSPLRFLSQCTVAWDFGIGNIGRGKGGSERSLTVRGSLGLLSCVSGWVGGLSLSVPSRS